MPQHQPEPDPARIDQLKEDLRNAGYEVNGEDIHVVDVDMASDAGHAILAALMKDKLGLDINDPKQVAEYLAGQNLELAQLLVDRGMHLKRQIAVLRHGAPGQTGMVDTRMVELAGVRLLQAAKYLTKSALPHDAEDQHYHEASLAMLDDMIRNF